MSLAGVTPRLKVSKTLSHPVDPAVVLGFEGRNIMLGLDCLVLKAETLPVIRDNPAVTHFIIPEEQATNAEENGLHIYVLDKHEVYHAMPVEVEDAPVHTGTKYGEKVTGRKVAVADMDSWPRGSVEVSN